MTRDEAERALELLGRELGIWRIPLQALVEEAWPDEVVLMPALGAPKTVREDQLRRLERLRRVARLEAEA